MKNNAKIDLTQETTHALTFQSYGPEPAISDVLHVPLCKHVGLNGWFMEHLRMTAGKVEGLPITFTVRQISVSKATPGRINAFHIHPKAVQDELWCVIDGSLLIWLVDCRNL